MKRADAVCREDAEEPRIGVRVPARNVKPVEAETIEGMTGLSDHDALSQLIELADHCGRGIGSKVIGEKHPGDRRRSRRGDPENRPLSGPSTGEAHLV